VPAELFPEVPCAARIAFGDYLELLRGFGGASDSEEQVATAGFSVCQAVLHNGLAVASTALGFWLWLICLVSGLRPKTISPDT
jgi:hypothetical protein